MAKFETLFSGEKRIDNRKNSRATLKWIHYEKLVRSAYQFYREDDEAVEAQADIIEADGAVLQNILVRQIDADEYEIIAGHKRTLGCKLLVEKRGLNKFALLPAFVIGCNDIVARFRVMSTNVRPEKTPYETLKEIEDMKYLLENHSDELGIGNEELRGRMVERIGRQLNMKRSKVSDYNTISNNLGDLGRKAFEQGELNKSAALAISALPEPDQEELLAKGVTKAKDIVSYKKQSIPADEEPAMPIQRKEESNDGIVLPDNETSNDVPDVKKEPDILNKNESLDIQVDNSTGIYNFISNYKTWDIWTKNELTEETFYRYEFSDESAVVVRHYLCCSEDESRSIDKMAYYLLKRGYKHFMDCEISKDQLIKVMQSENMGGYDDTEK